MKRFLKWLDRVFWGKEIKEVKYLTGKKTPKGSDGVARLFRKGLSTWVG